MSGWLFNVSLPLKPLFQQEGILLPRGTQSMDLLDRLVEADPLNLNWLTTIYQSLETLGSTSPYFQQILVLGGLGTDIVIRC